jgi:hypothetical protein
VLVKFAFIDLNSMASTPKPLKAHPNSPLAKIVIKMAEDKKLVNQYMLGEISREELEAKGVRLVNPF